MISEWGLWEFTLGFRKTWQYIRYIWFRFVKITSGKLGSIWRLFCLNFSTLMVGNVIIFLLTMHNIWIFLLRILTGKKHHQMKLWCFRKVWMWTFGWLVYQINSLNEILKLKQNSQKNKVDTGKTPFSVISSFFTPHSNSFFTPHSNHWLLPD